MTGYFYAFAMAAALMFTPRTLAVTGNLAGASGYLIFPLLAFIVACFLCLAVGIYRPYETIRRHLTSGTSQGYLFFLPTARFFFYAVYTTSIAALAGYIFNEVFVYWFPNLGFSFLLLALVCLLQLADEVIVKRVQLGLVLVAVAGLSYVALGSFTAPANENVVREVVEATSFFSIITLGALLFVGFDMAGFDMNEAGRRRPTVSGFPVQAGPAAVLFAGLLLMFFSGGLLHHLTWERLADTSVPHMKLAGRAFGDTGRMIMGGAALAACAAAMNGLILALRLSLKRFSEEGRIPVVLAEGMRGRFIAGFAAFLPPAVLMGLGFAGEDILETWIGAGFAFWLLSYVFVAVDGVVTGSVAWRRFTGPLVAVGVVFCLIAIAGLYTSSEDQTVFAGIVIVLALVSAWLGIICRPWKDKKGSLN